MTKNKTITVETRIASSVNKVWELWTEPEHIKKWNNASVDWFTPSAENDLQVGGKFTYRMEARDGSFGFDFGGTYDKIEPEKQLAYTMDDGRKVTIDFQAQGEKVHITETFEPEDENPVHMQKKGWQAILDNFKKYTESKQH